MSEYWIPQVLDVEAQQVDRKLFAVLHRATANAVEPFFLQRFDGLIASEIAQEFGREADTLRRFLWPEAVAGQVEDEREASALSAELALFLQESIKNKAVTASDRALARQLADEFAGAVWATLISCLVRAGATETTVAPDTLLPRDLQSGSTALLRQVQLDTCHFELSGSEIQQVLTRALNALLQDKANDDPYLSLPRRMRLEREALRQHIDHVRADGLERDATAHYDAVRLERGRYKRNGGH